MSIARVGRVSAAILLAAFLVRCNPNGLRPITTDEIGRGIVAQTQLTTELAYVVYQVFQDVAADGTVTDPASESAQRFTNFLQEQCDSVSIEGPVGGSGVFDVDISVSSGDCPDTPVRNLSGTLTAEFAYNDILHSYTAWFRSGIYPAGDVTDLALAGPTAPGYVSSQFQVNYKPDSADVLSYSGFTFWLPAGADSETVLLYPWPNLLSYHVDLPVDGCMVYSQNWQFQVVDQAGNDSHTPSLDPNSQVRLTDLSFCAPRQCPAGAMVVERPGAFAMTYTFDGSVTASCSMDSSDPLLTCEDLTLDCTPAP